MNKTILIIICVIVAVGGLYYAIKSGPSYQNPITSSLPETPTPTPSPTVSESPTSLPSTTHAVTIQGFAFNQSSITIKKGDTVIWTNKDSVSHTVTSDRTNGINPPTLDSPILLPGQSFRFTFTNPSNESYHCSIHPSMTGTVIVTQ